MRRSIAKTLTASFALLWVMSVGLGVFSLQRMRAIHGRFEDVVEQRGKTVQLANQAAELHLENAKLTMQRILVDVLADPEGPGRLTAEMAVHSKSITTLMEQIEQRSTLPREKELFAAIKELRAPYVASRARAAKLFEDKKPKEAMAAVSVMMADLAKYRGAWAAFVRHQEELTAAAVVEGKAAYASARSTSIVVLTLSALLAAALAGLTVRAIRRSLASVIATADRIGRGDLQSVTAERSFTEIDRLSEAMGHMTQLLARTIGELRAGVYGIDAAAREVASASDGLAQGTHEQAASVVQTTARLREIHASITSSTEKNRETEQRALEGAKNAADCESAVDQTLRAMRAIADKIAIVEEIAERTNLLALNAAVEAAHAGHHGRGFAEVANAVRALSESSSVAAKEIRKLAGSSVDLAERSRALLGHLLPSIETTATLVQGVATAARDQAAGIDEIRTAMDQVDGVTQHHASAAEQLSSTSESLASQAATIRGLIAFFQVQQARPA